MFLLINVSTIEIFILRQEAEQKRLEEEMQKRKNRIEQWRAERRIMLGIDKVMQQSVAQATKVG